MRLTSAPVFLILISVLPFLFGCSSSGSLARSESDKLQMEIDDFHEISPKCLQQLKVLVEKEYKNLYDYKNTIRSREKNYFEAIFSPLGGSPNDSVIIVKIDTACVIKKMYRTKMILMGDE